MSLCRLLAPGVILVAAMGILVPPAGAAVGVWTNASLYGADVRDLALDPSTPDRVFAATASGGVYVSQDGGQNWVQKSAGLPKDFGTTAYKTLQSVTVDPVLGRVYATGSNIYYSDNQGQSWLAFSRPGGAPGAFGDLFLDPDDSQKFTAQNDGGVFVYDLIGGGPDRGWTQPPGMDVVPIWSLDRAPSDVDRFYAVAGSPPSLYESTDRVVSWNEVGSLPGAKFRALAVDPADPSRLYLSMDSGCFVSDNSGATWVRMDDPQDQAEIYRFGAVGGDILAVGRGGLYSNVSDADKLAQVAEFLYTRASDLVTLSDGSLLMGCQMGVFAGPATLVQGTGAFVQSCRGMSNADITAVAPAPGSSVVYAVAGQSYDAGVFRSPDNGQTWEHRSMGITNPDIRSIAVYPGDPDIVYVGTAAAIDDIGENGKVFKTTDGGLHWTDVTAGIEHVNSRNIIAIVVDPRDPDIVYASAQVIQGGIYKSTDGGATWARRATGLESMPFTEGHEAFYNYFSMLSLVMDPRDPNTLFIGSGGCWGGTYRTTNGADTWVRRAQQHMELDQFVIDYGELGNDTDFWFGVHLTLYDIDVDPNDSNHLFVNGARADYMNQTVQVGVVWESTDHGESWSLIRENAKSDYFDPVTGLEMHRYRPGELYVSTRDGVLYSNDWGATWSVINEGLGTQDKLTRALAMDPDDPNRLYLATALSGVWIRDLTPVAVSLSHMNLAENAQGLPELRWGVASAVDHAGFYVDREAGGVRERLTPSLLRGQEEYVFVDDSPVTGVQSRYWIVELDRFGRETDHGPLEILFDPFYSNGLFLSRAFPNPFFTGTSFQLEPPADAPTHPVTVRIYDIQGREVRTLVEGLATRGVYDLRWNGKDSEGRRVRSGIYYIHAVSGGRERVERVLVVR